MDEPEQPQVPMDAADEEDPIVEEIPIFLSHNLEDRLYLLQYPTKTAGKNIDQATVVNCCVKPLHNEVKVDFALDTAARTYDQFKGELIAKAADGNSPSTNEQVTYKRGIMDKHSYRSSTSVHDVGKYMVGVYAQHEIHVTPLKAMLQMRPSFSYYDKEDRRNKAEQRALDEDDEEDDDYQQVMVKFARNSNLASPSAKKVRERHGYDSHQKRIREEPWCETFWHPVDSPTSELERQRLFSTCSDQSDALMQPLQQYVEKILPNDSLCTWSIDALVPPPIVSKVRMKRMPLGDQLKILLRDAKMLTFNDVVHVMKTQVDPRVTTEEILNKLPQIGILLKGNWVVQSESVYPPESRSNVNGVSAELMIRARDYVIFRLSRTNYVHRRQVEMATQLPAEETLDVLSSIARLNKDRQWELLLPPCTEFEERNPELVQRQEMVWRATELIYNEMETDRSVKRTRVRSFRETKPGSATTASSSQEL